MRLSEGHHICTAMAHVLTHEYLPGSLFTEPAAGQRTLLPSTVLLKVTPKRPPTHTASARPVCRVCLLVHLPFHTLKTSVILTQG